MNTSSINRRRVAKNATKCKMLVILLLGLSTLPVFAQTSPDKTKIEELAKQMAKWYHEAHNIPITLHLLTGSADHPVRPNALRLANIYHSTLEQTFKVVPENSPSDFGVWIDITGTTHGAAAAIALTVHNQLLGNNVVVCESTPTLDCIAPEMVDLLKITTTLESRLH